MKVQTLIWSRGGELKRFVILKQDYEGVDRFSFGLVSYGIFQVRIFFFLWEGVFNFYTDECEDIVDLKPRRWFFSFRWGYESGNNSIECSLAFYRYKGYWNFI